MSEWTGGDNAKDRSVFVGNIPYDVTEENLTEIFSQVGKVANFRIVYDRDTGKPKGYGFCEFSDTTTALSAMRNLNGYDINGRMLRVDFAAGGSGASNFSGGKGRGENLVELIELALKKYGTADMYDMLIQLQKYAKESPQECKNFFRRYPILSHALILAFKDLNIETVTSSVVQAVPPPLPAKSGSILSQPAPGGILGAAPTPIFNASSNRAPSPPALSILGAVPPVAHPKPSFTGSILGDAPVPIPEQTRRDPRRGGRQATPSVAAPSPAIAATPATTPAAAVTRPADPRRKRRSNQDALDRPAKTGRHDAVGLLPGMSPEEAAAIASLAQEVSRAPEKLNLLSPEERQIVQLYLQQVGSL